MKEDKERVSSQPFFDDIFKMDCYYKTQTDGGE